MSNLKGLKFSQNKFPIEAEYRLLSYKFKSITKETSH